MKHVNISSETTLKLLPLRHPKSTYLPQVWLWEPFESQNFNQLNAIPTSKILQNNSKRCLENVNISSETTSNLLPLRHPKSTYLPQVWLWEPFESQNFNQHNALPTSKILQNNSKWCMENLNALPTSKILQNNSKCCMKHVNISSETTLKLLPLRHPKSTYLPQVWLWEPFESQNFNQHNALPTSKILQNNSKWCTLSQLTSLKFGSGSPLNLKILTSSMPYLYLKFFKIIPSGHNALPTSKILQNNSKCCMKHVNISSETTLKLLPLRHPKSTYLPQVWLWEPFESQNFNQLNAIPTSKILQNNSKRCMENHNALPTSKILQNNSKCCMKHVNISSETTLKLLPLRHPKSTYLPQVWLWEPFESQNFNQLNALPISKILQNNSKRCMENVNISSETTSNLLLLRHPKSTYLPQVWLWEPFESQNFNQLNALPISKILQNNSKRCMENVNISSETTSNLLLLRHPKSTYLPQVWLWEPFESQNFNQLNAIPTSKILQNNSKWCMENVNISSETTLKLLPFKHPKLTYLPQVWLWEPFESQNFNQLNALPISKILQNNSKRCMENLNAIPTSKILQNNSKWCMENVNISSETTSNLLLLRHPKSTYLPQVWLWEPFESQNFNQLNALPTSKILQNNSKCCMKHVNISSETTLKLLPLRHPKSTYLPQVWLWEPFESQNFNQLNALPTSKILQNNSKRCLENSTYLPQVWLWEPFESQNFNQHNALPTSKILQNNSKCCMKHVNISSETTLKLLPLRHPKSTYLPQVWLWEPFESQNFNQLNALPISKILQNNSKRCMENVNISSETTSNLLLLRHPKSTYLPQVWLWEPFESQNFNQLNALPISKILQNNSKRCMENVNISSETTSKLLPLRHPKSTYLPQVWLWEPFESQNFNQHNALPTSKILQNNSKWCMENVNISSETTSNLLLLRHP
ncbi:unnamed protein product [Orchesella dallaii]|uniref:Uncharacterized protein n=1 Tax=Orchesella dallaii TaxID=48710 RepID=A0ABP1S3H3_9HEXA